MADLNTNLIEDELNRRSEEYQDIYFAGESPDISDIRDGVLRVVDFVLGEKRDDREDLLKQALAPVTKEKKKESKFFKGLKERAKKWAASWFKDPEDDEETPPPAPEPLPERDEDEFKEVLETVQDILPTVHALDGNFELEDGELNAKLRAVIKENQLNSPDAAFIYRDVSNFGMKDDYIFAVAELKKKQGGREEQEETEEEAPTEEIKEGEEPANKVKPKKTERREKEKFSVFQLRVLANARKFARERYALLNHDTPKFIPMFPEDFERAHIGAYLDHIEPHDMELREAALRHALKSADDEKNELLTLAEVLDASKFKFLKKDEVRDVLRADATYKELSDLIRKGLIPLNSLPGFIGGLRKVVLDGDVQENFVPLILKLHKLYGLYSGLSDVESLSREELNDAPHAFLDLIAKRAGKAREAVSDDVEKEKKGDDKKKKEEKKGDKKKKDIYEKSAEVMQKLRNNPAVFELVQTSAAVFFDIFWSRLFGKRRR